MQILLQALWQWHSILVENTLTPKGKGRDFIPVKCPVLPFIVENTKKYWGYVHRICNTFLSMCVTGLPRAFAQKQSIYCGWHRSHFYDIFFQARMYLFYPVFIKVVPPQRSPLFRESSLDTLRFPSETKGSHWKQLLPISSNWEKPSATLSCIFRRLMAQPELIHLFCTYISSGITWFLSTYFQLFVQASYLIF